MAQKKRQYIKYASRKRNFWQKPSFYILILVGMVLLLVGIYQIPAVQDKAYYHVASLRADLFYFFRPPDKASFNPTEQGMLTPHLIETLTSSAPTATSNFMPTLTSTPYTTQENIPTPTTTSLPTQVPTPIPSEVKLTAIKEQYQRFNNCGPTNLSMALGYWGWEGDQYVTEKILKPRREDRNVMPYEMLEYVQNYTKYDAVLRYGGDMEMIKQFVAAGFPVLIERGYMNEKEGWMGHYGIITAYNDQTQRVRIPDSYIGNTSISYEEIEMYWAQFDDIYLIIYPPDREQEVLDILGPHVDKEYNLRFALDQVTERIHHLEGQELFFAGV